ncbi:MAG TPA: hypothetical protein VFP58_07705 [Candidatus Eisenbacteria bacterium]|nr:hypothetical protein [Candidatus Eisenbacteria bacterium]
MPTNKDLKRLVRARMKKTGEAYTAARSQILRKKTSPNPVARAATDDARRAGMSDSALQEKTGRTWALWVAALDRAGAEEWPHRKIAKHLYEDLGVPGWWSQMVAVGYERIKGRREIGQRHDGAFEASKSKTFAVPVARLYRAWKDSRTRTKWLPGAKLTIRAATTDRSMRITWDDGTSVDAWFVSKGPSKSQVAVAHAKLTSKADVAARKAYWDERLRALEQILVNR